MDISNEILEGLTEDVRQKVAVCTTPEELLALAASEGVELTAEQIEMVSGGASWDGGGEPSCYRVDYL